MRVLRSPRVSDPTDLLLAPDISRCAIQVSFGVGAQCLTGGRSLGQPVGSREKVGALRIIPNHTKP